MNNSKNIPSIINQEQTFIGEISSKGVLIIHGTVKGKIVGESINIYKDGLVCADIKAADISIGGTFEGEIMASNKLEVRSTGSCTGKVVCRNLIVEAGGILNAEVTCLSTHNAESGKKLLTAP